MGSVFLGSGLSSQYELPQFTGVQDTTHVEGRTQNLRQTAACLQAAVAEFTDHAHQLSFVLTLGDIIDGNFTPNQTAADFERVARTFDSLVSRWLLLPR